MYNWQDDLTSKKLSNTDKTDIIRKRAEMLQEAAGFKEKMYNINNKVEEMEGVDDMMSEALKAKVQLLMCLVDSDEEDDE